MDYVGSLELWDQDWRAQLILLLGGVDGHQVWQRGDRAKLALRVPVEHDLNFDANNTLHNTSMIHFEKQQNIYAAPAC